MALRISFCTPNGKIQKSMEVTGLTGYLEKIFADDPTALVTIRTSSKEPVPDGRPIPQRKGSKD